MRHLKLSRKFGRNTGHRKALFRNLVTSLIQRERIRTTLAKAKELRSKVEKTITLGKRGTLHARRLARSDVTERSAVQKLFGPLAARYAARKGGYTRIIKLGNRLGDNAPMAYIELVDREIKAETTKPEKAEKIKKEAKPKKEAAAKKPTVGKKQESAAKKADAKGKGLSGKEKLRD